MVPTKKLILNSKPMIILKEKEDQQPEFVQIQKNGNLIIQKQIQEFEQQSSEDANVSCRKYVCVEQRDINTIRIMSYNILAPSLVHMGEAVDDQHLNWKMRANKIFKEIQYYQPDIIGFQEMDSDEVLLSSQLSQYQKVYQSRFEKPDGCGIFYNKTKFQLIQKYYLYMNQAHIDRYFLDRGNVALFVLLQYQKELILVVNCHLIFNTKRGDVKILQIVMIIKVIKSILKQNSGHKIKVAWLGDFNLIPNSPIYTLIKEGSFDFQVSDIKRSSGQDYANLNLSKVDSLFENNQCYFTNSSEYYEMPGQKRWVSLIFAIYPKLNNESIKFQLGQTQFYADVPTKLKIPLSFQNSYAEFQKQEQQKTQDIQQEKTYSTMNPLITTLSKSVVGTVDYIWILNCKVQGIFQTPDLNFLQQYQTFPNADFPSDHLPLVIDIV